jgi:hypothetical protein
MTWEIVGGKRIYICCRSRRSSICTREGDKVDVVEAEVAELLLKYGEVVGGSRKIQGPVEVGGLAVQPSEKDTPAGSSRLHVMAWACVHYYASKVRSRSVFFHRRFAIMHVNHYSLSYVHSLLRCRLIILIHYCQNFSRSN